MIWYTWSASALNLNLILIVRFMVNYKKKDILCNLKSFRSFIWISNANDIRWTDICETFSAGTSFNLKFFISKSQKLAKKSILSSVFKAHSCKRTVCVVWNSISNVNDNESHLLCINWWNDNRTFSLNINLLK